MEENLNLSDESVADVPVEISADAAGAAVAAPAKKKHTVNQQKLQDNLWGWIFCLPLIIGTVWFVYYAFILALMLSFTAYDASQGGLMDAIKNYTVHPEGAFYWYKQLFETVGGSDLSGNYDFVDVTDPATGLVISQIDIRMNEMGRYLFNTVFYMIGIPIGMVLSVFFAVCMSRDIKGGNLFRVLYYIPCVASSIAIVYTFKIMFRTNGVINSVLGLTDFKYPATGKVGFIWISEDTTLGANWNQLCGTSIESGFMLDPYWCQGFFSKAVIIIMSVWKGLGGTIILYVAGLSGVNAATKEAAQIDGANGWQIFWKVTMPDLYPVIFYNIVTSVIGGLQIYAEPELLMSESTASTGFPMVSGYVALIYRYGIVEQTFSRGAAYGMFLAIIIFILTLFQFWLDSRRSD